MSNIIDFQTREQRSPHSSGKARCLACAHVWIAVSPIGTIWMECPACKLMKGRYVFEHQWDRPHWTCNCGCDLFSVTPEGFYCPNCGEWQKGF